MNTASARRIPMLARTIQRTQLPCCCMRTTTIRFRSSLTVATNPVEWKTSIPPSYSSHFLEQRQQPPQERFPPVSPLELLSTPSNPLDEPDTQQEKPKRKRGRPKVIKSTIETTKPKPTFIIHNETSRPDSPTPAGQPNSTLRTYQGQAMADGQVYFPELEPAPFPRNIDSSMPYMNRSVPKTSARPGVTGGPIHNNLQTFEDLEHNTDSSLYHGTLFEYQTQEILKKCLGIYTQRSAGNGDLGVDLRGTWFLPLSASPQPGDKVRHLKVIVQCKKMGAKVGPKFVRELQGSLSYESQPTMAILAISSEYTKQALLPYAKSLWPMALVVIDTEAQECRKLMWNRAAESVMHGLQVGTTWLTGQDGQLESRPVLCFEGKLLERLPGPYMVEGQEASDEEDEVHVDYAIPDWDINTGPEYLYEVPQATAGHGGRHEDEDEDADSSSSGPLQSGHLELLTWHPPSLPPLDHLNRALLEPSLS